MLETACKEGLVTTFLFLINCFFFVQESNKIITDYQKHIY